MTPITPILPGSTVGFIGGGQLGRMLALDARQLGYRTVVLDPKADGPAAQVCDEQVVSPLTDATAAMAFAAQCDVVTLEWENADVRVVRAIAERTPVRPGPDILAVAQNRIREKEAANAAGLETAPYHAVESIADLKESIRLLGTPAILKTAQGGYDGKGQRMIRTAEEAEAAYTDLDGGQRTLVLEGFVEFDVEVSVIVVRTQDGGVRTYPVSENEHRDGVLDVTIVPARIAPDLAEAAVRSAVRLAEHLDLVGILAVEMFVTTDGHILVNEIAPRPHNSGHYTLDACSVSQFEQNIRAICGLPVHQPSLLSPCAMANLLGPVDGSTLPTARIAEALSIPDVSVHLYGKKESRPGRKMGHLTALAANPTLARELALQARDSLLNRSVLKP